MSLCRTKRSLSLFAACWRPPCAAPTCPAAWGPCTACCTCWSATCWTTPPSSSYLQCRSIFCRTSGPLLSERLPPFEQILSKPLGADSHEETETRGSCLIPPAVSVLQLCELAQPAACVGDVCSGLLHDGELPVGRRTRVCGCSYPGNAVLWGTAGVLLMPQSDWKLFTSLWIRMFLLLLL